MSFYVVDRIEGSTAVVVGDDDREFNVPRRVLPKGTREGTVLRIDAAEGDEPKWDVAVVDEAERIRRIERARKTLDDLSKTDPGGDIDL